MAAPRCAKALLGTAKRIRISSPRPVAFQTFLRWESSDAKKPDGKVEPVKKEEKKEGGPKIEKAEAAPVVEKKVNVPASSATEKVEVAPAVESKVAVPAVEKKEDVSAVEAAPVVENKEVAPAVENKETVPAVEKKETAPAVEKKETDPAVEKKETIPAVETKETLPATEAKETIPAVETKETVPAVETMETSPTVETEETMPAVETKDTTPAIAKETIDAVQKEDKVDFPGETAAAETSAPESVAATTPAPEELIAATPAEEPVPDRVIPIKSAEEILKQLEELGMQDGEEEDGGDSATLWNAQQEANKRMAEWQPKTKEEARQLWEKLKEEPDHYTLLQMFKKRGLEPIKVAKARNIELPGGEKPALDPEIQKKLDALRNPINVQAIHLRPLRRAPEHGIPSCDIQFRSYSIRNLQFFTDFAMRAAYYLGLCAKGPIPLPRITERWTVPRANFIFKKSQENFERKTLRRLIQIQDGHPDVVKVWLAFLQKHQFHGVGMKANIWQYESLEDALRVGEKIEEGKFDARREGPMLKKVEEILKSPGYAEAMRGYKSPVELRP